MSGERQKCDVSLWLCEVFERHINSEFRVVVWTLVMLGILHISFTGWSRFFQHVVFPIFQ